MIKFGRLVARGTDSGSTSSHGPIGHDLKIDTIGGCERANRAQDDRRIKWQWYDSTNGIYIMDTVSMSAYKRDDKASKARLAKRADQFVTRRLFVVLSSGFQFHCYLTLLPFPWRV
jgi:hypothetical protein